MAPGNQIYLKRPQIDRLLEKAVQKPVVIVCAGAGYGKTQAVYSFLREYPALTCWIQLSDRDNIGERFWENFIAGVTNGNRKAALKLADIDFPRTEREFDRYLTIPLADTREDVKYIFVYDDFHLLHHKAVLRFLERSITSYFPSITSILISRTEPPLNLETLQSKGLVGRITEDELRFSQAEMVEYFHTQNIRPSPQAVSSIYHDTEGWAFAIHLAGLSLKNSPPGAPYVPQAMRSNIFRLIESEIMSAISAELRKFLIKLSLIEHLVPDLLREIAASPESAGQDFPPGKSLVDEMERICSFIQFDVYLNAYQIHHLLLEYLSGKQQELSGEEKQEVYRRAAGWCAQNNRKLDAISYYEKSRDYDRLITIADTLPLILPRQFAWFILELLNRLSREIHDQYPLSYAVRARVLTSLCMFEECTEELKELIPRLEALPPSPELHWVLMALYANRGLIGIITCAFTGDYRFPVYLERAAYHAGQTGGHVLSPPLSEVNLGAYTCMVPSPEKKDMDKFIEALSAAAPYLPAIGGCGWGIDDLARAELAYFREDIAEAERFSLAALDKAQEWGQYEIENRAFFFLLRISLSRGNYEKIQELFRQMEAQRDKAHYVNICCDIICGWYYTQIGQTDKLAPWLKNDFEESDLNSMSYSMEILVKAKYHFMEKRYPAALAVLESRIKRDGAEDFVMGKIESNILKALCWYHLRDKDAAFAALEEAYSLALPNALFMPFTEMGKAMRALAAAALKDGSRAIPQAWLETVRRNASGYAKKVFKAAEYCRAAAPERTSGQGVTLSRRELEVLTGLYQGMTREEIAGASSLSINTIKSIIRTIYNKLEAVNKADAVRIAVARGLVGTQYGSGK
jgi:LuxR family maltose regulon positive regulatory protein